MKTTKLYGLVAAVALVFGAAACGGDDDSSGGGGADADSPLVQALAANMVEEGGESPVANQEEAECWASGVVGGIGEDRLGELGVTPESVGDIEDLDLTDEEVAVVVDSLFDCADVQQAFADMFAADFGDEAATCIADKLDEDFVKQAMSASIAGDDAEPSAEFLEAFGTIASECGLGG
jgi:hypothetical protein